MKYIITIALVFFAVATYAEEYFSTRLCESGQYNCMQANQGDTWANLFPDAVQRDLIQRFNRMNTPLRPGMYVAIPEDFETADRMSLSPFPFSISPPGSKLILVDLTLLAWAAYSAEGHLIRWGPASGGRSWCYDTQASGKTVTGVFDVYDIRGKNCTSTQFPKNGKKGGAPMPFPLFFKAGYALHGSDEVPGYNASHGCIRLFKEDAKWLNTEFVKLIRGAKVWVLPYDE